MTLKPTMPDHDPLLSLTNKPFGKAPPNFLVNIVLWLSRQLHNLGNALIPPEGVLFDKIIGMGYTQILGAIVRHDIPDHLKEKPLSSSELAQKCGLNADALHRVMRASVTVGMFDYDADGRLKLNRLSKKLLREDPSQMREMAAYISSPANYKAYGDIEHVLQTGQEAFAHVNNMDLWDWFDANPDELRMFARMSMGVSIGEAPIVASLYPFPNTGKICDVGGGSGILLSEVLLRNPQLEGMLYERPTVVDEAHRLFETRGVNDRVEILEGDFWQDVPSGADIYMMKNIMHDWDDEKCIQILRNIHTAADTGSKVLIIEILVEPFDATNYGSLRDIHVLTVCDGGRERSRNEYTSLLEGSGFKLKQIYASPIISVVEGEKVS